MLKSYLQSHVSLYAYHCQTVRRSPVVLLREHCCRLRLSWDEHVLVEDDLQVKEDFWVSSSTPWQRQWRYGGVSMVTMVLHRNSGRNAFNKAAAMRLL